MEVSLLPDRPGCYLGRCGKGARLHLAGPGARPAPASGWQRRGSAPGQGSPAGPIAQDRDCGPDLLRPWGACRVGDGGEGGCGKVTGALSASTGNRSGALPALLLVPPSLANPVLLSALSPGEPAEQALQYTALLAKEAHARLTRSGGRENRLAVCRSTVNNCCKYL